MQLKELSLYKKNQVLDCFKFIFNYSDIAETPVTPKSAKGSALKSILKKAMENAKKTVLYDDFIEFNDGKEWNVDFYKLFWDEELNENLYCVVQYLERKEGVIPTVNAVISRKLIEDEYDWIGYSVIQLNNPDGTIRYGTYTLDLYQPPIYVEELDELKRTPFIWKVTVGRPGIEMDAPVTRAVATPPLPGSKKKVQIDSQPYSQDGNKTPKSRGKKKGKKLRPMKMVSTPRDNKEDNNENEEEKITPPPLEKLKSNLPPKTPKTPGSMDIPPADIMKTPTNNYNLTKALSDSVLQSFHAKIALIKIDSTCFISISAKK